jgi:thiaminase
MSNSLYLGHALNPDYQALYEQAVTELSQYGREQDRYYCRRLDRYVSEQEVQRVASLERTLDALERGSDKEHILELMNTNLPDFVDRSMHARYVTDIVHVVERF